LENIKLAVSKGADAIAGGAFFVFNGPHRAVLISYPKYNDLTLLFGG
jgi:cyclase